MQYSQQFITGTSVSVDVLRDRSLLNSSTPLFNPSLERVSSISQITQNLLQGFGIGGQQPLHPGGQEQHEGHRPAGETAGDHHGLARC